MNTKFDTIVYTKSVFLSHGAVVAEAGSPSLVATFSAYVYVYLTFQLKMCLNISLKSSPYLTEKLCVTRYIHLVSTNVL
jgi:hypothetical protein